MSLWDKIKNAGRSDEYDEYEDDYLDIPLDDDDIE